VSTRGRSIGGELTGVDRSARRPDRVSTSSTGTRSWSASTACSTPRTNVLASRRRLIRRRRPTEMCFLVDESLARVYYLYKQPIYAYVLCRCDPNESRLCNLKCDKLLVALDRTVSIPFLAHAQDKDSSNYNACAKLLVQIVTLEIVLNTLTFTHLQFRLIIAMP
jgi:hypothetical protein